MSETRIDNLKPPTQLDEIFKPMFPVDKYTSMSELLEREGGFFRQRNNRDPRIAIDVPEILNGIGQIQVVEMNNIQQNPYDQPVHEMAIITDGQRLKDPFNVMHTMLENLAQYGVFIAREMPLQTIFSKTDYSEFISKLKQMGASVQLNPATQHDDIFFKDLLRRRRDFFQKYEPRNDQFDTRPVRYEITPEI
jgi:hypothetical protein